MSLIFLNMQFRVNNVHVFIQAEAASLDPLFLLKFPARNRYSDHWQPKKRVCTFYEKDKEMVGKWKLYAWLDLWWDQSN